MASPLLYITDGTDIVDFLSPTSGFHLDSWEPALPRPKGGGVFMESPLTDGRQKAVRVWDNAIESLALIVNGFDPDAVALDSRKLYALLLKADAYWMSEGDLGGMVWLVARRSNEANTSYALITNWGIPGIGGETYKPPFANGMLSTLDKFILDLEHEHWLENEPGVGTCVQLSGQGIGYAWGANQLENPGFETAGGGGADVFANWTENAGTGAIAQDGTAHSGTWCALLTAGVGLDTYVYQSQAGLAPGSTAALGFWTRGSGAVAGRYRVYDVTNAADILAVASTGVTAATYTFVSYSFTLPAGCTEVRVYFYCPATNGAAARFDDANLRIRGAAWTPGRTATCEDEVFIANKQNLAQLTDIYRYDSSAGTYTQILGTALPYNLYPPDPPLNDILYFMIDASVPDSGPFSSLVFDIGVAQANITTIAWEYWSGAAWSALVVAGVTYTFSGTGVAAVTWDQPADWAVTTVNGVNGWMVRARITATAGVVTIPTQQNRDIYTVTWNSAAMAAAQTGGDIGALRRSLFSPPIGIVPVYRMVSGIRSIGRGADFMANLNLADEQNPAFISVSLLGVSLSFVSSTLSPSGRVTRYTGATSGDVIRVIIASGYVAQWSGKFRVFLRYNWLGAGSTADTCTFQLGHRFSGADLTTISIKTFAFPDLVTYTGTAQYAICDLGILNTALRKTLGASISVAWEFWMTLTASGAYTVPLDFIDLILIPVDESAWEVVTKSRTQVNTSGPPLNSPLSLDADSISLPIPAFRGNIIVGTPASLAIQGDWLAIYSGEAIWQPDADQRVWSIPFSRGVYDASTFAIEREASAPEIIYAVQGFRANRYLGLRGAG